MKKIKNFKFNNKTVLLRADLNSDVIKGKVLMSERIKESVKTIIYLKKKKAKIVIIAHQGQKGKKDFISLEQHAKLLNKFTKVKFVKDIAGKKAINEIKKLKTGQAILLENIRFHNHELKPEIKNNELIKKLVPLADIYVNDAFSNSHRAHTSMIKFAKYLPSCGGLLLEKEINALKRIKLKDCLCILGGAKPEENLRLLNKKKILACGLFGQLCLIAKRKNLGAQNKFLKKEIRNYDKIIKSLKFKLKNIQMPIDFAVKINGKRKELLLKDFPSEYEIFDIGENTQKLFVKEIKKAKTIYMKGPVGFSAEKQFAKGTNVILKAIADSKAFSVIGGGHLSDAIKRSNITKSKFNRISLSGGALLRYLAGEKLPGLEVLR